jgi:hypothetical protein
MGYGFRPNVKHPNALQRKAAPVFQSRIPSSGWLHEINLEKKGKKKELIQV